MRTIKQGKILTIILSDGTVITETNVTKELEKFLLDNSTDEKKIKEFFIVGGQATAEDKEKIELVKNVTKSTLLSYDTTTGQTTMPTVSKVSVPKALIDRLNAAPTGDVQEGLINFWKLACRNPNEHSRNNLLWFLEKHNFTILKSGLFVAYRNVLKVQHMVSVDVDALYHNIKNVQKKSPKKFQVIKTKDSQLKSKKLDYKLKDGETYLGVLEDLAKAQTSCTGLSYTDKHTKTFDIQLGSPVSMPREKCDTNSNNTCSRGLHVACKDWTGLKEFGDTTLAVLVNPIDVVAVPTDSNYSKMRVCQYFPLKVVEWKGGKIEESIQEGDALDFWEAIVEGKVNEKDPNPHAIYLPKFTTEDFKKYIADVTEIRSKLKNKLI